MLLSGWVSSWCESLAGLTKVGGAKNRALAQRITNYTEEGRVFFPERIESISEADLVLEVGPGSMPHPRSDVYLDIYYEDRQIAAAQRGFAKCAELRKPLVHYGGGFFPFKDGAFDYAVCSHVLEHVPSPELGIFLRELSRVASRGYLEFPTVFYELINYPEVHRWFLNYREGVVLLLDKTRFRSTHIHRIYREMFYGRDPYLYHTFRRYKEFYFRGFEWESEIRYRVVTDYDDLVNDTDYQIWSSYFSTFSLEAEQTSGPQRALVSGRKQVARALLGLLRRAKESRPHDILPHDAHG